MMNIGPAGNNTNNNLNSAAVSRSGLSWTPPAQNSSPTMPNPFAAQQLDPDTFFNEVRQVTGKPANDLSISKADLEQYGNILQNAAGLLNDTIQFSQQAASPQTNMFLQQQQGLSARINLAQGMLNLFDQQA
jgi:hypothetical protein